MESNSVRYLELRSRALELEMRSRRITLGKLSAAYLEASTRLHRTAERFGEVKQQLLGAQRSRVGSASPVEILHHARGLSEKLAHTSKAMQQERTVVAALEAQMQEAQQLVNRGERQLDKLGECSQQILRELVGSQERRQAEELVEVVAHRPDDIIVGHVAPGTSVGHRTVGSLPNADEVPALLEPEGVEESSSKEDCARVDSDDPDYSSDSSRPVLDGLVIVDPYFSNQLHMQGAMQAGAFPSGQQSHQPSPQSQQNTPQPPSESYASTGISRTFRAAVSAALERQIESLQSWDRLSGQGVGFSIALESGSSLGVQISAGPGGAVQVVLEPDGSRDRHALSQQRQEIIDALTNAGCEVKQVLVRGRTTCRV
ncbi:MAG: hypothetical protein EBZ48_10420 [Proteobacteria bacterium]|nr:hypothetical protein [Pseudomonadota bacterium]